MKIGIGKSALLGVALAAAWSQQAFAATGGSLDRIVNLFINAQGGWEASIKAAAMAVFGILVTIEVAWTLIKLGVKGADYGEFAGEIANRIMFVGFFSYLLMNGGELARSIINSLRQVGNSASTAAGGSGGLSPSDIFDAGVNMATTVLATKVELSPAGLGQATVLMIAGAAVCICFALMAALMVIALVESYIVSSAAIILMGFGGTRWTKDFAITALRYAVSVGVKLMAVQMIAGMGESVIKAQAAAISVESVQTPADIFVVLGFGVVMLALTKSIPDILQGIINGTSISAGGGAMTYQMASSAIGAVAGAGVASVGAMRLASAQLQAEGAARSLGAMAGRTLQNMAGAAGSDTGASLGGRSRGGSMGGRMGYEMNVKADSLKQSASKPALPQGADPTAGAGSTPAAAGQSSTPQAAGVIKPAAGPASATSAGATASAFAEPQAAPGATPGQASYTAADGTPTQEAPPPPSPSWSDPTERETTPQAGSDPGAASPISPTSGHASPTDNTHEPARPAMGSRLTGGDE